MRTKLLWMQKRLGQPQEQEHVLPAVAQAPAAGHEVQQGHGDGERLLAAWLASCLRIPPLQGIPNHTWKG